jgi:TMEM175 potassium channel family protein
MTTVPARAEAFSDGVFAIAVTLLVLDLHVPDVHSGLLAALAAQWPHYASYVVSFGTIGIIWVNHHAFFDRLQRVDRPLLFLNLAFLLLVSVLPFPTSVLSAYLATSQGSVAAAVYSLNMAAMGFAFGIMVTYATRRPGLLTPSAAQALGGPFLTRFAMGGPVYLVAAAVAFWDPRVSLAIVAALALYYAVLSVPGQARHEE